MWTNKSLDKEDKERRKNTTRLKETDTKKMGLMYMVTVATRRNQSCHFG